ncbi:MAG: diacylglycerol kinase family protein, partial [Acidaminococcaceae bacterium]
MKREHVEVKEFNKVMLIYNSRSGRQLFGDMRPRINEIRKHLRNILAKDVLYDAEIKSFEQVSQFADKACQEQYDWVIVAGGDGTLRAVTEVFVAKKMPMPYMSIFPAGTVNLVAKELQMSIEPLEWIKRVRKGIITPVWLGKANDRVFLTVAGIGVDSLVVDNVTEQNKKL